MKILHGTVGVAALSAALTVTAAGTHDKHGAHGSAHAGAQPGPRPGIHAVHHAEPALTEGGQGAFAALGEAVARLESDPNTDWAKVNVSALREHLVDMNLLMLASDARATHIDDGLRIEISAAGRAREAVQRMVPAHAAQLAMSRGWHVETALTPSGASWRITARTDPDVRKIQALGFYGLMALEQHHQAHHWALVRGADPHAHGAHQN